MKLAFLGDISLNDNYVELANKNEKPFRHIHSFLNEFDGVIGNLECLIEGDKFSPIPLPILKTDAHTLKYLNEIPVSVVSLAANHVGDNYEEGFDKTIGFLKENNIKHLGAAYSSDEAEKPIILSKGDVKVGLLNYLGNDFQKPVPLDFTVRVNRYDKNQIIKDIELLKKTTDHVVLLFHWGTRVEEGLFPDWYQMQDAKDFIDSGADLIIGHHSHTFQPYEIYKGKYIFYSLGNFCFSDVYWKDANGNDKSLIPHKKRAYKSGIANLVFSKESYSVKINYIKNNNGTIIPLKNKPFTYMFLQALFPFIKIKIFWRVYYFYNKRIDWLFRYFFGRGRTIKQMYFDLIMNKRWKRGWQKLVK